MHIGEYLPANTDAFSPWFPREADNAIFTIEIISSSGENTQLLVEVYSKNTEDTGPGEEVGSDISWETVDSETSFKAAQFLLSEEDFGGFDEMVRFRFTVSADPVTLIVESGQVTLDPSNIPWVRYRIHAPTWFDTAVV